MHFALRITFFSALLGFALNTSAQEFPDLTVPPMEKTFWQSGQEQVLYWPNGTIQVDYVVLEGTQKLRREFYESGNLKSTQEVHESRSSNSTMTTKDGITTTTKSEGVKHQRWGVYLAYLDSPDSTIRLKGEFKSSTNFFSVQSGKKTGEWLLYDSSGTVESCTFVEGKKQVNYAMYSAPDMEHLVTKGKFFPQSISESYETVDNDTGAISQHFIQRVEWLPSGRWIYFDETGSPVKTEDFGLPAKQ